MTTPSRGLWRQRRVAEFLDTSVRTVQRLAAAGDLTPVYIDSVPRFRPEEVEALAENARTTKPGEESA